MSGHRPWSQVEIERLREQVAALTAERDEALALLLDPNQRLHVEEWSARRDALLAALAPREAAQEKEPVCDLTHDHDLRRHWCEGLPPVGERCRCGNPVVLIEACWFCLRATAACSCAPPLPDTATTTAPEESGQTSSAAGD